MGRTKNRPLASMTRRIKKVSFAVCVMTASLAITFQMFFNNRLPVVEFVSSQKPLVNNNESPISSNKEDNYPLEDVVQRNDDKEGLSVLSYSLYGTSSRYANGMIITARQCQSIYPDWEVRVYHDDQVPQGVLRQLANITAVRLIPVTTQFPAWIARHVNPRCWRFLVASDPAVDLYAIRDADSEPTLREKMAVDEWARSGTSFHIMRDHPMHNPHGFAIMLAGMWGGRRRRHRHIGSSSSSSSSRGGGGVDTDVPSNNMQDLLFDFYVNNNTRSSKRKPNGGFVYTDDQDFLGKYVLPLAQNDCLQHDSYYCVESGGVAFPMTRQEAGNAFEYVGNSFNRMSADGKKHSGLIDYRLNEQDAVGRYNSCLVLRQNLTEMLVRTLGSSSVLEATPYIGRTDKTSTELWDATKDALFGRKPVVKSSTKPILTYSKEVSVAGNTLTNIRKQL